MYTLLCVQYLINAEYNKNWDASYIFFSLNSFIVFSVVPVVLNAFSYFETRSKSVIGPKLACLSSLFLFLFFFFFSWRKGQNYIRKLDTNDFVN